MKEGIKAASYFIGKMQVFKVLHKMATHPANLALFALLAHRTYHHTTPTAACFFHQHTNNARKRTLPFLSALLKPAKIFGMFIW